MFVQIKIVGFSVAVGVLSLVLVGCGQKGPLVLRQTTAKDQQTSTSAAKDPKNSSTQSDTYRLDSSSSQR